MSDWVKIDKLLSDVEEATIKEGWWKGLNGPEGSVLIDALQSVANSGTVDAAIASEVLADLQKAKTGGRTRPTVDDLDELKAEVEELRRVIK